MPYIPKGILKKNWIKKHISFDPAVVVIFYDCDWDDESWNEKISECSSRVQSIRLLFFYIIKFFILYEVFNIYFHLLNDF